MSPERIKISGFCNDCRQPHGRGPRATLCFPCRSARLALRRTTLKYRFFSTRYNRSPRGKLKKAEWFEKHRDHVRARMHDAYVRRRDRRGPTLTPCATTGCTNTFVRRKGSHRMFCEGCQVAYFGRRYVEKLGQDRRRGDWRAA